MYQVMNEVVVDRGPSPYLCNLDLYIEHKYITSVQGDGKLERGRTTQVWEGWRNVAQTQLDNLKFMYSLLRCTINAKCGLTSDFSLSRLNPM